MLSLRILKWYRRIACVELRMEEDYLYIDKVVRQPILCCFSCVVLADAKACDSIALVKCSLGGVGDSVSMFTNQCTMGETTLDISHSVFRFKDKRYYQIAHCYLLQVSWSLYEANE